MSAPVRIVNINPGSDGDDGHKPDGKDYRKLTPPTLYLVKLGALWMKHRPDAKPGYNYILNQLPNGYAVWERPRPGNPNHVDKWCYGHPSGFKFDSPNRFFPHFLHLMEHGSSDGCSCNGCSKSSKSAKKSGPVGRPPGRPSMGGPPTSAPAVGRTKGRAWVQGRTDDEGTPDVYRNSIDKLKKEGTLDALIKEDMSMDWRVERENIAKLLSKTSKQPSYLPRLAEIVLFVRKLRDSEEIRHDGEHCKIWDRNDERFTGTPKWEAGVVTQLAEEECSEKDLTMQTPKQHAVNYAGFRVEPLPDPNSEHKSLSKQYTYVYLNQIRPFIFWRENLAQIPERTWSPTIQHALTVMSSVALVEKYRFKGSWPTAKVFNRGVYIGSEFISEGDFVRLLPTNKQADEVTDILRVDSITLAFTNLDKANDNDYDDGRPYNSAIYLTGTIFTLNKERALTPERMPPRVLPVSFEQYGPWFRRTELHKLSRVPFHRVMGRCHDPAAMQIWHPNETKTKAITITSMSTGLAGLKEARAFSTRLDKRIADGKTWLWEESRAQALDLHEINGYDTAAHDEERDPKEWRKQIRILNGTAGTAERMEMQDRVLIRSSKTNNNSMMNSALRANEEMDYASVIEVDRSRDISRKRGLSDVDSSEEEDVEDFVNQMAMGIPIDDEKNSSNDDDGVDNVDGGVEGQDAPRGRRMEIVLD